MLHCRAFTQRGSSALGPDLGSQLVLELLVRADVQAPALSKPGFGALGAHRTRITGAGRKLGGLAWDHRHGLSMRTGDGRVHKIQGEVVFREEVPNLRRNRSGRALIMLRLGLMEPLETRGAERELAHRAELPHMPW